MDYFHRNVKFPTQPYTVKHKGPQSRALDLNITQDSLRAYDLSHQNIHSWSATAAGTNNCRAEQTIS